MRRLYSLFIVLFVLPLLPRADGSWILLDDFERGIAKHPAAQYFGWGVIRLFPAHLFLPDPFNSANTMFRSEDWLRREFNIGCHYTLFSPRLEFDDTEQCTVYLRCLLTGLIPSGAVHLLATNVTSDRPRWNDQLLFSSRAVFEDYLRHHPWPKLEWARVPTNAWIEVWIVVDFEEKTAAGYLKEAGKEIVQFSPPATIPDLSRDLAFLYYEGAPEGELRPAGAYFHVDDIYLDPTGRNLSTPPGVVLPKTSWHGFAVESGHTVDTGDWLGVLHILHENDWVYSFLLERWLYVPEAGGGEWIYVPR